MAEQHGFDSATGDRLAERAFASRPGVAELIGFNIEEIGDGRAEGSLQAGPQHAAARHLKRDFQTESLLVPRD